MTREEWLVMASDILVPYIQERTSNKIPKFHVSVGFPKGHAGRQAIGQCWAGTLSEDNNPHIFISPVLVKPIPVLETLIHEIIHTAHPLDGHKKQFAFIAMKCGLLKPWTATTAGPELIKWIEQNVLTALPDYPHSALTVQIRGKKGSRLRKHTCNVCGSIVYKGSDDFRAMCLEELAEGVTCGGSFSKYNIEKEKENEEE